MKKTNARVVRSMLTAGFHAANPPLVWRFDLERNHSFTLSVQGDEGDWELGVMSPKGEFYNVAHFLTREEAEEALDAVEKALGRRRLSLGVVWRALLIVGVLAGYIAMGVLLYGLYTMSKHQEASVAAAPSSSATSTAIAPSAEKPNAPGVPLSADDILVPPER